MADRIVVLDKGAISQVGTPLELYHKPQNLFVAGFIGNPKMNFLPVTCVAASKEGAKVTLPGGTNLSVHCDATIVTAGQKLTLGIRPEHIGSGGSEARIDAIPTVIERLGVHTVAYCSAAGSDGVFRALLEGAAPAQVGKTLPLTFNGADCHLFSADGNALERHVPMTELDPNRVNAGAA